MKLIPSLKTVLLTDATPGELLRIPVGRGGSFLGIIAKGKAERSSTIVCLTPTEDQTGLTIMNVPSASSTLVLSYGRDYTFHLPASGRYTTPSVHTPGANGAMLAGANQVAIRIRTTTGPYYYDIAAGALLSPQEFVTDCWELLDWEIRLNSQPTDAASLFSFKAPSPPAP